jgi:hypothetical protein
VEGWSADKPRESLSRYINEVCDNQHAHALFWPVEAGIERRARSAPGRARALTI